MRVGPANPNDRRDGERRAAAGGFASFRRVLTHVWPHRRLLIPAMLCMVVLAGSFSVGIATMLPVLQAIIKPEGVPVWVQQTMTANRLGADVHTFISDDEETELRGFDRSILVTRMDDKSPLRQVLRASDLPAFIHGLGGEARTATTLYRAIAAAPDDAPLPLMVTTRDNARHGGAAAERAGARAATQPQATATQPAVRAVTLKQPGAYWRMALWASDRLPQGSSREDRLRTLVMILVCWLVIEAIGGLARFGGEYMTAIVAGRTLLGIRRQMYRKVLRLPLSFFAQHGTSDVMSRFVQDSQSIYRGLTYIFVQSVREPLKAIGTFAFALFINWKITLVMVIGAPMALLVIRRFGKSIRKRSKRVLQGYGRMLQALEGALTGIRVVKGFGGESYERRHLYETDLQMFRAQAGIERIDAMTSPLFEFVGFFFGAILSLFLANQVMTHQLDPGEFMLIIVCIGAMFDPVRKLSNFYNRIEMANAGAQRVFEIIDMPDEVVTSRRYGAALAAGSANAPTGGARVDNISGALRTLPVLQSSIEFKNVVFTYAGAERPALAGVSLRVNRGERVAIVGPNGSGKTTLLGLLMRFFEPDSGQIEFDGVDVRAATLQSLREQIGLVTQDSVIFADTIRNNIAYGEPALLWKLTLRQRHPGRSFEKSDGDARVISAAQAAYAHEFITQIPGGYDAVVGEHGATLSGGQKQRLAIARAILANAPILIFDEATSQIDSDSEHKIHEALHTFLENRTAFIIAHRFSTILEADRIVVMESGRVVDSGKHAELLSRCSLYKTLFETQLRA